MQGAIEALLSGLVCRGLGPVVSGILMAAPLKKVARAQLKKIYVLDERGEMAGEYILDSDCPIDYNDFLKVLPDEGIGDRDSLFVGEYVLTAFQSGKFVFVLLSRGQLAPEDVNWTALLLTAADSHLAPAPVTGRPAPARAAEPKPDLDKGLAERDARLQAKEKSLAELEAKLKADAANLSGRQEELDRQKARLAALADYSTQLQDAVSKGASRSAKTLEIAEQLAASSNEDSKKAESKAGSDARQAFEQERKALVAAKTALETRYQAASARIAQLEKEAKESVAVLEKDKAEAATRAAEEDKTRREIESRVADLSQRFTSMAKERLVASHRPPGEVSEEVRKAMEGEKAELARERKFLQRRAIELLDREERVRDREARVDDRDREFGRREQDLAAREQDLDRQRTLLAQAKPQAPEVRAEPDEAKKDIERRVKIIQQKALDDFTRRSMSFFASSGSARTSGACGFAWARRVRCRSRSCSRDVRSCSRRPNSRSR